MTSLRETKNRIKSVRSTEKITRAMKMVAASKLRRAQEAVMAPRPYGQKLSEIISRLALKLENYEQSSHPLLEIRSDINKIDLILFTSDRGLCGGLNSNAIRAAQRFVFDNQEKIKEINISCIGRKGFEGLGRAGFSIKKNYPETGSIFDFNLSCLIAKDLCDRFKNKDIDAVYLIYNNFRTAISQEVVIEKLLPVEKATIKSNSDALDFIYEPAKSELLDFLVPKHFATKLWQAYLESFASEQGARMTAMDNSTRNAKEMIEKLTLEYNRVRQAVITKELMEIIGGAEAL